MSGSPALVYNIKEKLLMTLVSSGKLDYIQEGLLQWSFVVGQRGLIPKATKKSGN